MNVPEDRVYSEDHLWLRSEPAGRARVGITEYAQDALGEVVFVDLPATGTVVNVGEALGEVESTKSVTELCCPVTGEVIEVNDVLELFPGRINEDPYGDGWVCVLALAGPGSLDFLMSAETYRALLDV